MLQIGSTLRQARERRRLSVYEAAVATWIPARYLLALEHEKWRALPGRADGTTFLREYADYLGLDSHAMISEYVRTVPRIPARHPQVQLSPTTASLIVVAVLLAIGFWIG